MINRFVSYRSDLSTPTIVNIDTDLSLPSNNGIRISIYNMLHGLFSVEVIYPNNTRNSYHGISRCEIINRYLCATLLCTDFHGHQMEIALSDSIYNRFFGNNQIAPMDVDRSI